MMEENSLTLYRGYARVLQLEDSPAKLAELSLATRFIKRLARCEVGPNTRD